MQVTEKEREALLQNIRKELINIISSKVVHPDTNRLFPPKIIEEAILSLGFDVKMNDSAKKQANFLIKELASKYILKKADMEIKVSIREEWISEGEKAGVDIQPTISKKEGLEDEDEEEEHEAKKPVIQEKKPAGGKKKNKKHSDDYEWDEKPKDSHQDKSENLSKMIGRDLFNSDGPEDAAALKLKHEKFLKYLQSNSISLKEVKDGKLISYVCIIESAKYKEISVETKKFYPKSICEITEYMIINKSVFFSDFRKPILEIRNKVPWRCDQNFWNKSG